MFSTPRLGAPGIAGGHSLGIPPENRGVVLSERSESKGATQAVPRACRGGLHAIYGIVGAMVGEYLFFWIVIGKGNAFSDFATAVLGSVTIVGVARLIAAGRSPLSSK